MDPKTLAGLDPKLRETYEKVMGGSATPVTSAATPPPAEANIHNDIPIPDPVASAAPVSENPIPPIPSPSPAASDFQATPTTSAPPIQPVQPADLAGLQPTLSGALLPDMKEPAASTLSKPLQPLPSPASVNQQPGTVKGTSPFIRILYILAGTIFFIVYAIFWMKMFNYPLPF